MRAVFRQIEVRINRRNSRVPSTPLAAALAASVPSGEQPITLAVAPFAVPGKHEAVLTLLAGLQQFGGASGAVRRHVVVASVLDREGREMGMYRQTLELTPRADRFEFEVFSRIAVKPGTYEVRVGEESDYQSLDESR